MTVVFLDHAGIGMPQLFGDHRQWHAAHRKAARIGMTQHVEVDGGIDPSRFTSHLERVLKKSGQNIPKNRCRTTIAERVMETLAELPLTGDQVVCLSHEPGPGAARSIGLGRCGLTHSENPPNSEGERVFF